MFATRTLRAFVEDEAEKAEAEAEVAVDAALWDRDAMRDAKKRARAEELEKVAREKRARLDKLGPDQRQLKLVQFFATKS